MILASRLELEVDTILDGIEDEARREHAGKVLGDTVATLTDHEARRPLAEALGEVVRTLERVQTQLDAGETKAGLAGALGSIDVRTWVGIVLSLIAAAGAATGIDVAELIGNLEEP